MINRKIEALLSLFSATLFLSALLLFSIQPMVAKMVLPMLGGSPAVWNTVVLFFQATLLVGYLYVHATSRFFALKAQTLIHIALLVAAFAVLPFSELQ